MKNRLLPLNSSDPYVKNHFLTPPLPPTGVYFLNRENGRFNRERTLPVGPPPLPWSLPLPRSLPLPKISFPWLGTLQALRGPQARVKSRKWNFLKNFIEVNCYTGTYWKTRPNSVTRSMREHTSGFFWNSHGWCRIFRRIFWYHRLLPKKIFCRVIWDLGPFFDFGFWPVTRKRLILETWFRLWGPLFFQFPTRWPIFFFFANFLKKRCMTQSLFSRTWTRSGGWKLTCDSLNIWIYPWRNFFTRHNDRSKNGGW